MTRKLTRAAIVGGALIATMTLAACSGTGTGPDTDANRDAQPTSPTSQPAPTQVPEEQPADDGREVDLRATYTWEDGTTARVTDIRRVPLSEFAVDAYPGENENLILTVKLTAGPAGLSQLDPFSSLQYGPNRGATAEMALEDGIDGMQGGPDRLAKGGSSLTGTFGYMVPKGSKPLPVAFTFNPSHPMWDAADPDSAHADATFVGSA